VEWFRQLHMGRAARTSTGIGMGPARRAMAMNARAAPSGLTRPGGGARSWPVTGAGSPIPASGYGAENSPGKPESAADLASSGRGISRKQREESGKPPAAVPRCAQAPPHVSWKPRPPLACGTPGALSSNSSRGQRARELGALI